jgi:hypothetical protein
MKFQKAITPTKSKLFFNFIILTLFSIFQASSSSNAQLSPLKPLPPFQVETGLEFENSQFFNSGSITTLLVTENTTLYAETSTCSSGAFTSSSSSETTRTYTEVKPAKARFISSTTLPAPGLRVIIRNITKGIDQNPSPYTNRKYDKSPSSQEFQLRFGTNHSGRYLAVREGKNNFSYEIKRNDTVVETGTFTASIYHETKSITRNESATIPTVPCPPPLPDGLKN